MSVELLEPEVEVEPIADSGEMPPIFGKCPACGRHLFPRDKITGEPRAPIPGSGYESRAKCSRCGAILAYVGNGDWRILLDEDLTEEDREYDRQCGQ
jgi:hypothetical protein